MSRPPPVTPSPHRFIAGQRRALSPIKDARPPSTLRQQLASAVEEIRPPSQRQPQPSQFARTPRFGPGKSKAAHADQRLPSPPKPAVVQAFRASTRPTEAIEDAPIFSDDDDDETLDGDSAQARPTIEGDINQRDTGTQWSNDLAFSPKRRRLDESHTPFSPTRTSFQHPQTLAPHVSRPTPHFNQALESQDRATTESSNFQRPSFLRPSTAQQETIEPLPETFSPHKRGQKFVPGGLAATVQQWVVEIGQAAVRSRKGQGYLRGDDYLSHVKIELIKGNGPYTVHGRLLDGDPVNLLLTGGNHANRVQSDAIGVGRVVGIRAPMWDLEMEDRSWIVGVDWRILS